MFLGPQFDDNRLNCRNKGLNGCLARAVEQNRKIDEMPCTLVASQAALITPHPLTVELHRGIAECMGDGIFVLFQADDDGKPQTLVLSKQDLEEMLALC